jgi:hypothetical protein
MTLGQEDDDDKEDDDGEHTEPDSEAVRRMEGKAPADPPIEQRAKRLR